MQVIKCVVVSNSTIGKNSLLTLRAARHLNGAHAMTA